MGQLRHWPEQQRAIRLVVQKAVAGRGIDLDIMWYLVSAQSLPQRLAIVEVTNVGTDKSVTVAVSTFRVLAP